MKKKLKLINAYTKETLGRIMRARRAMAALDALIDIALLIILAIFTSWAAATCSSETRTIAAPITQNYVSIYNNDSNITANPAESDPAQKQKAHAALKTYVKHGVASHMGHALNGRVQADGTKHNKNAMICAHKTLPFGTNIKVTNKSTGKSVIVKVTDRGPYIKGRVIDLSLAAAREIGMEKEGVAKVTFEIIK